MREGKRLTMFKTFNGTSHIGRYTSILALLVGVAPAVASAATTTIPMTLITPEGVGASIGTIEAEDTTDGLTLTPDLTGLPPGEHGFHVHQNPDCGPGMKDGQPVAGLAAGGHWDPENTGKHLGPGGGGHKGDLPRLAVANDGTATAPMTVPGLSVADLEGRSLMIHAGGDNYSDEPKPLGGGGARIACGVVE